MTLKNFLNWVKYSGIWVGFVLNPYHWEPDLVIKRDDMDSGEQWGLFFELNLGIVWIRIVIDDGRW